jgi:hypothetical protein
VAAGQGDVARAPNGSSVSPDQHDERPSDIEDTCRETVDRVPEGHVERLDALFVQSATGFTSEHGTVTLHGLTDSTLYLSNCPRREVGHLSSRRFVELWYGGINSFAVDPPNAVVSFLDDGSGAPDDAVVVLREPRLAGRTLTYRVDLLEGTLPEQSGPCALFIDVFGRPLSPVSIAGAERRKPHHAARRG